MASVSVASEVTSDLVDAVHRLLPQLSASASLPGGDEIAHIMTSPATALLIARDEVGAGQAAGPIVGMLTLVTFRIPTGVRAWIEDVVVDGVASRRGVGESLVRAALEVAAARGAQTVDLTSRPSRQAANQLYRKVGFEPRDTNVYRFKLGAEK